MPRIRVYIKPFLVDGSGYASSFIEVTNDVIGDSLGRISRRLDISDYDVGVFTNSAVNFELRNDHGKYSDIGYVNTIFNFKRSDSIVKITWDVANWDFFAGLSSVGDVQGNEVTVYQGLLSDESTTMDSKDQTVAFDILGYETILDRVLAPDWVGTPPADNKCSTLIKAAVAAADAGITASVLTIDNAQIVPFNDVVFDSLSVFAGKTCKEAINQILLASNSVLYLNTTTPVVSSRAQGATVDFNFYGPGSSAAPENIIALKNIRGGINRTFNYATWKDTTLSSSAASSQHTYGIRKKEITIDGVTNTAKRQSILDSLVTEFGDPKQEFDLTTYITYDALNINLLSKGNIDFPLIPYGELPLYGVAIYGTSSYPGTLGGFQILTSEDYKVLSIDIDLPKNKIDFKMRRTG